MVLATVVFFLVEVLAGVFLLVAVFLGSTARTDVLVWGRAARTGFGSSIGTVGLPV